MFEIRTGLKNLDWVTAPQTSATITTMTSDFLYQIDQILTGIIATPAMAPGTMTAMQINKTLGVVG